MSNAVAKVSFLQGYAWAKTTDGNWRALTVGSTLHDDEVLVTAQGARIELDTGNGTAGDQWWFERGHESRFTGANCH